MSRSEDYLDQLLRGITPDKTTDTDLKQDISEDNLFSNILDEFAQQSTQENSVEEHSGEEKSDGIFRDEFEDEDIFGDGFSDDGFSDDIFGDDTFTDEDFLKEFEREMAEMEEASEPFEVQKDTLPEETIAEKSTTEENAFTRLPADEGNAAQDESSQEDADVLKILEGLNGIDLGLEENAALSDDGIQEFGVLEDILTDDGTEPVSENPAMDEIAETENKSPKKDKKDGFLNKLGLLLFGEEEEDDEEDFVLFKKKGADKKPSETSSPEQGEVSIGVATEADLALFEDYSAAPAPEEEAKTDKKKKKEKKEKKEKVKKEKKPKPKKEKKPKKPKEPDNTPPLPKKPVILIFFMVASMVVLIILGSDLLGYSNQLSNAKNLYAKKNYSEAFAEISGMEMKEADMELYNKYHVMAIVSVELEAYESLMSQEFYDMALDCLVRTIGRAEKYKVSAEEYGCIQEMNGLEQEAETILYETFHMSKEQALELYAYKNKKEYSTALVKVLRELGLEEVTDSSRR